MAKPVIKLNNMFKAEKEDDGSTIEKLKYFSGYTTAHGFGRLVESKSYVRKVFWVMACLGAFTMFSCQVVWLAQDYISKPVETYITLKHVKDIDFPVVTICNHNIIRRNEISSNKSSFLQQFLRDFLNSLKNTTSQETMPERDSPQKQQEKSQVDDRNHKSNYSIQLSGIASASTAHAQPSASISVVSTPTTSAKSRKRTKQKRKKAASTISSPTTIETQEKKKKKAGKNDKEAKGDKYNKQEQLDKDDKQDQDEKEPPLNEYVVMQNRLHLALANCPEEELSKLGHQFKDMIRECTFKGRSCAKKNFWTGFWHYTYGNCFSFNQRKGLRAGGPGPGNGLLLEINVEQNEYDGYLTRNAGIRVHIGKPGKVPFPYEKGFSVGPGTSTSVGMRKIQIKRVDPFKNGSCMGEKGLARDNLYRLKYNATYSTTACREGCLSDRQMEICNCREYRFPKDARKNERVCDVMNATVAKCLAGVIKKYRKSNLACTRKCPSPCNEDVFKLTISTSKFPSLAYENIIRADSTNMRKANIPPDQISSYLLQLNVFFEELNYEVIEENIGYGLVNFISDIGGNMGMWIGISVLTCAEILELLCIMVHHAIKRCAKQQTKIKPMK